MCLILFAYNSHPRYPLIVAANRDEFYARPTAPADFWQDAPDILAGRDLVAGGTWLGVAKNGRFAAVTNYRDPFAPQGTKSRGALVNDFLRSGETATQYLREVEKNAVDFSGFNLLVGSFAESESELVYFSNRSKSSQTLANGVYGLSNHLLDTDWRKVRRGKIALNELLSKPEIEPSELLEILQDKTFADNENLPETGVGIERERVLSAAFIETPIYGTRCSTAVLFEADGTVNFVEQSHTNPPFFVHRSFQRR